jgi:cupin 2 domain-containing protein
VEHELFEEVLRSPGVRIERIISRGHTTPAGEPYVQDWDEWVLVQRFHGTTLIAPVG